MSQFLTRILFALICFSLLILNACNRAEEPQAVASTNGGNRFTRKLGRICNPANRGTYQ